jgi:DHA1 family bicyclomycin/chloramphenicol resistance-like MFS transporter
VDAYGTRRSLAIALCGLVITSLACAAAPSIAFLNIARFLQGCTAAAVLIAEMAFMSKLYKGNAFIRASAFLGMVITFTLALAPVLGGYIGSYLGWRMTFIFLSLYSAVTLIYLPSFMPSLPHTRKPLSLRQGLKDYSLMLTHGPFITCTLITAFLLGICLAYVGLTAHLFIEVLGVRETAFGYYQGVGALAYAVGCLFTNKASHSKEIGSILRFGSWLTFMCCTIFLGVSLLAPSSPLFLTAAYIGINIAMAFAYTAASVLLLELFPHLAGSAAALATSIRMLVSSSMVYMAGIFYNGHVQPLGIMVFCVGLIILALYIPLRPILVERKAEAS